MIKKDKRIRKHVLAYIGKGMWQYKLFDFDKPWSLKPDDEKPERYSVLSNDECEYKVAYTVAAILKSLKDHPESGWIELRGYEIADDPWAEKD